MNRRTLILGAAAVVVAGLAIVGARTVLPTYGVAASADGENVWRINRTTGQVSHCSLRRAFGGIENAEIRCSAWGP